MAEPIVRKAEDVPKNTKPVCLWRVSTTIAFDLTQLGEPDITNRFFMDAQTLVVRHPHVSVGKEESRKAPFAHIQS